MVQQLHRYSAGAFCIARALARERAGAVATEYAVLVGGIAFIAAIFEIIKGYLD
jgi:Flp pilus assembly pilin Flp